MSSFLSPPLTADSKVKAARSSAHPSTYVGVTHKSLPRRCAGSTRANRLNLCCGKRGPASVMAGGRCKAAAGRQVCSWRTGCCAGVMKARQKKKKNRINGAITTWTEAKRSPAFYCILQAPPGGEAPPQTDRLIWLSPSERNDITRRSEELLSASAADATRAALWTRLSCDQTPLKQTCST